MPYVRIVFERYNLIHCHFGFGNRSRFINTDYVNTRQSLYTFHIVNKSFFLCKSDRTCQKCNRCQEIKSLGNHSYQGGNRVFNRVFLRKQRVAALAHKHQNRKGNNDDSDNPNKSIERPHHSGAFALFHLFCIVRNFGGKSLFANRVKFCAAGSRYYKASRHKAFAARSLYLIGFTRNQRLIDIYAAVTDNRVRRYLISRF